jgi:hypothetical protein
MNIKTFPGVLDALTYIEHHPSCIEASIHFSMYNSTSKCIMHACASHLSMVTYSHTPTPTLKISLYASIHFSTYDSTSKCIMQWACITSQYGHFKMDMRTFPRHPRCPHLHWASPFMYRGQYALMYTIQADVGACIKSDCGHFYMNMCTFPGILDALTYTEHLPFMKRGQYTLQYIW